MNYHKIMIISFHITISKVMIVHPRIQYKCDVDNICKKVIVVDEGENNKPELMDCPSLNHLTPILAHGDCVPCSSHT